MSRHSYTLHPFKIQSALRRVQSFMVETHSNPLICDLLERTLSKSEATSDYENDLQDTLLTQYEETKSRMVNAHHKCRTYFDRKADAQPLGKHEFCLLVNPLLTNESTTISKVYKHRYCCIELNKSAQDQIKLLGKLARITNNVYIDLDYGDSNHNIELMIFRTWIQTAPQQILH